MNTEKKIPAHLPDNQHLRDDVAPDAGGPRKPGDNKQSTPALSNAGQQVGGLAPESGYGAEEDPDLPGDNNELA